MKLNIIGGGIGGLTTAITLQQKGFETTVFEQAPVYKPIGAGIILANNAMQVYQKIGLKEKLEKLGNPISSMNITDAQLSYLSQVNLKSFEQKFGVQNLAIHRGDLQQTLIDATGPENIQTDHELSEMISNSDESWTLKFKKGQQINSQYLIVADGIHSKVRQAQFPDTEIRSARQICWRGVTDFELPHKYQHELNEAWGIGNRFGFVQLANQKVYWYALANKDKHCPQVQQLSKYYQNYDSLVREIIRSTPTENIHESDIADLKPIEKWTFKNICLIGDAAHATTPNMGQGACQAIEDAYVLGECLAKYPVMKAFTMYNKLRLKKAHDVVKMSWMLGKMAHIKNPTGAAIRNSVMKSTPASMNKKRLENIFQLNRIN